MAHVLQFAHEMGTNMSAAEVAEFLNENGMAQCVWIHMMQAGEQYIKSSLKTKTMGVPAVVPSWSTGDPGPLAKAAEVDATGSSDSYQ